jgi:hypothetical protein
LLSPVVQDVFHRAFADERFSKPNEVMNWLIDDLRRDDIQVLIARDDDANLVGLSITAANKVVFSETPWILHFFSDGPPSTTYALVEGIRQWLASRGESVVRVINQTGHSDEAHMRIFSRVSNGRKIGGVIEYDVLPKE